MFGNNLFHKAKSAVAAYCAGGISVKHSIEAHLQTMWIEGHNTATSQVERSHSAALDELRKNLPCAGCTANDCKECVLKHLRALLSGTQHTNTNSAMPKLPTWEEVYKACFYELPDGDLGAHSLRVQAGRKAYEFIVRQLSE